MVQGFFKIEINVLDIWELWGMKSFYISRAVSYEPENEIWAGFVSILEETIIS